MTDCNHSHWVPSHHYRPLEQSAERQTWAVVVLTGLTMVAEIVAGYVFHSMALLADGWHMASHMVAIGMAAMAYVLARRYAHDRRFAFGTWKIEVLAGFASAVLLVVVAVVMILESLTRFWTPAQIGFDEALWVAVIGLSVNLLSAWLLRDRHDHHHHHHAHDDRASAAPGRDLNRHAAFLHVLTDALTSVAAIVALLGGKYLGLNWLDPLMGIIGAVVILIWAKGLLRETAKALLDREMDDPLVQRVRARLEAVPDTEVTDLHLWRVGRVQYGCIVSIVTHQAYSADRYKAELAVFSELVHVTAEVNRCGANGQVD
ncbi:CDF family Co(II)/Ni(II) efflux transporter DmeF [Stutzerimonas stutzeri]|uniref:CDF family Co(II)/Ni(II) efflux transporter DmeF n=1 Tax=Stutzerimonas stutzeri TaxID=316 RepID=A0A6I6LP52_STUST|nr:CDF family Co(II)/Ni(II) efflux transporter DmeF [Stutzerimonas stutzeri]QGZ32258.1 CDF family Co(II)/Ni(II) efflux transporter DmeF [Stutzerimonas stutzeri]